MNLPVSPTQMPVALERRVKRFITILTLAAVTALAGLRAYDLWDRRDAALAKGERRAANLALILSAHLRSAFAAADATMRQLAAYSRQVGGPNGSAESWSPLLGVSRTQRNALGSISIIDADGIIRHSSVPTMVGSSRRDTALFRKLESSDRDRFTADTPYRTSYSPDVMLIPLGRKLTDAQGRFAGAVFATFTPVQLREFFEQVNVGRDGHIWVFHPDGLVLFHAPSAVDPIGAAAADNPLFAWTQNVKTPAVKRFEDDQGNLSSVAAVQSVGEPRIFVAVTLSPTELLAEWKREVVTSAAIGATLIIAVLVALRFLFQQLDARARAEEALGRAQRLDAIGHLTGGVAHDFNNILTVIMMNISVWRLAQEKGKSGAEQIGQIEDAARRASALTRQLLTFARRQPLQPKPVDLNPLLTGLRPMLTRLLGEDIHVDLKLAVGPCQALLDVPQFETAIMNLAINARDAMPRGGNLHFETGHTRLDAAYAQMNPDAAPGEYVTIVVRDTGHGIAAADLPRVFEPFFTTKPVGRGTGLGLSMVYGFVKQSGGHIKLQSAPGEGTTVRLYFPVLNTAIVPAADAPAGTQPLGAGETVLLVEDEPAVRDVAVVILRGLGYRVLSAADGTTALRTAKAETDIAVLLTDVVLPGGMNGRQLAEQMVALQPDLQVIYASGYSEDILKTRGQFEPGLRLVPKPYDRAQLAAALQEALAARAPRQLAGALSARG